MFTTALLVAGGFVAFLFVFQRKNLQRLIAAMNGQVSKLCKGLWGMDPIAVYQAEVDRSALEIQQAGEDLAKYRGLVARLERQVSNGEKEVNRLTGKIKGLLTENAEDKAAEYAVMLKKESVQLEENRAQLTSYQEAYQNNLKKVKYANQCIRQAKEKAEKLQVDLKMSEAEAETAKLAQAFNIKATHLSGLGEIEEQIQRQIENNRAKGQVISDLSQDGLDEIEEQEKLEKAEAMKMLEHFKNEAKN